MARKQSGKNFIIEIKSQENHTWQGVISWVEEKNQVSFRSALELLKLIDSALEEASES